ncbi:hypothetical protein MUK42_07862 [Musa troglodytarum]|uniref:Uncharacterized protein n=1 Tax=Musa troglodytarum TaxID=320322 RepID=A0A9E7LBQ4_9LILI|nr:hypothetical protein MUK42_07862 [Musa troglodytarum]
MDVNPWSFGDTLATGDCMAATWDYYELGIIISLFTFTANLIVRFGTGSTLSGGKNVGQLEEQKKEKLGQRGAYFWWTLFFHSESVNFVREVLRPLVLPYFRFGLKTRTVADEAAKKKMDTSEDEKRKARAIRFSQVPTPNVIGQANSDLTFASPCMPLRLPELWWLSYECAEFNELKQVIDSTNAS